MSSQVSPRIILVLDRLSSSTTESLSSVISVSSSDSEPEDLVDTMSRGPSSPTLSRSEASVAPTAVDVEQHAEHFHPGGDVKVLIGRTLYQLHGDVLARQSGWYRAYRDVAKSGSALPPGWRAQEGPTCTVYVHHGKQKVQFERPGAVEEHTGAIVVEDITPWAMDAFLAVLYPTNFMSFGLTGQEEWSAVLKVAYIWDCPAIRTLAIDRLDRELGDSSCASKAFDRLVLSRKYAIEPWTKMALDALVTRNVPLDAEEIEQMLPEDVAYVAAKREDRALQSPAALMRTPVQPMGSPLSNFFGGRVESPADEGHAIASPVGSQRVEQPYMVYEPQSPASLPSLQASSSPNLSILRAPSPPTIRTPMYTASSTASSFMESPPRSLEPLGRAWSPPSAPSPPRAWSTTPASEQSRVETPTRDHLPEPPRRRTPPPPPALIPLHDPPAASPAQPNVFASPPPVQVPPFVPTSPRAPTQRNVPVAVPLCTASGEPIRITRRNWTSESSRPIPTGWPYQASPSAQQWMGTTSQPSMLYQYQATPPVDFSWPASVPPPPPPVLPSSRPIPVPKPANTLF